MKQSNGHAPTPRLWLDLDNSPHVPLYAPLIEHLKGEGWELIVTARDFAQTLDLVRLHNVDALPVGEHAGKNKVKKVLNLPVRTGQLMNAVRSFRPEIALSHGSRTQTLASRLLRIPQVIMFDYEWTEMSIFKRFATHLVCPKAISADRLAAASIPVEKVTWYDGFKEDLYLPEFRPDAGFRASIGAGADDRLVTIRPPGVIGNYHDETSESICRELLQQATRDPRNFVVVLPKTAVEQRLVRESLPSDPAARVLIPEKALPGMQLLYHSDIAISGGGTMNRESALLGTPTYSMFTGRRAAIDEELARRGLLRFLEKPADVAGIEWEKDVSTKKAVPPQGHRLLYDIEGMIRSFVI